MPDAARRAAEVSAFWADLAVDLQEEDFSAHYWAESARIAAIDAQANDKADL